MAYHRTVVKLCVLALILSGVMAAGQHARADDGPATRPVTRPATRPAAKAPATQPSMSPAARALLDQVRQAYAGVKTLAIDSHLQGNFDVDGDTETDAADITSTYQAPNKFRVAIKEKDGSSRIIGSTGEQLFFFNVSDNRYKLFDLPGKFILDELDVRLVSSLHDVDLALTLALTPDASALLLDGAEKVELAQDTTIDNVACPTLSITVGAHGDLTKPGVYQYCFDPTTHLLRQEMSDLRPYLIARGAADAQQASMTMTFTIKSEAKFGDDDFAWAPPAGCTQIPDPPTVGGPALAFSLTGLDGTTVSAADLKGSVYILDFWATWCPPCRASLPLLDKIYQSHKAAGLKAYAIDLEENRELVQKFVDSTHLGIPVLLDNDGKVGQSYQASAIPQTVVVGKDGRIRKIFVGGGHDKEIEAEVDDALSK